MRILFIDIDTLRPDHMGCYGYSRNTTPNMDQVCREASALTSTTARTRPACPPGPRWSAGCSASTTGRWATAALPLTAG